MHIYAYILAYLFIVITFIPMIRNDYWTFRVFEFPRVQKLVVTLIATFQVVVYAPTSTFKWITLLALAGTVIYLSKQIFPFTPFGKKQLLKADKSIPEQNIRLMISNVYEDNENHEGCLHVIKKADPDVLLLLETNILWDKALSQLNEVYPYQVKVPLENTYGMLLFSKFPLKDEQVHYLVEEDIPSIHAKVELPSGQLIQLYCLHPTPPVPNENPRSTERDGELMIIAKKALAQPLPVIVCGDMNDVAWSYTTELFLKISQLMDPRRGRGMINTFHAHYWLLRFPLDHVFCSTDFKLVSLRRLDNFKSDHFPILIQLQYEKNADIEQEDNTLDASAEDRQMAEEKIAKVD